MTRFTSYLIAIAILAVSGLVAITLISLAPPPEQMEQPPEVPFVQTATVEAHPEPIPVYGTGTIVPSKEIAIAPQASGRISWVNPKLKSGNHFTTGEVLFRIESHDYMQRLRSAELEFAQAQVQLLKAQEEAALAEDELDAFRRQQKQLQSDLSANSLARYEPQLKVANANLRRAEAMLASAEVELTRTEFSPPFNGFVREEEVTIGQWVTVGEELGQFFGSDSVEVYVSFSDADASLIPMLWNLDEVAVDQLPSAVISTNSNSHSWTGTVVQANRALDPLTKTIRLLIQISDPFGLSAGQSVTNAHTNSDVLLIGRRVDVVLPGQRNSNHYRIPRLALQTGNEVWVVDNDNQIQIVTAEVLQRDGESVFVRGQLNAGWQVVTSGLDFAVPNMLVRR